MIKVFVDGGSGTTGLRIRERLELRKDIELIVLSDSLRKDTETRRNAINSSNITFLCLPDSAAKEAVSLAENPDTVIIDASTAHRTNPAWTYGLPELSPEAKNEIITSKRIANPGCHASGFITLIYPLVHAGIISKAAHLTAFSITGYSGGGKNMIADYESPERNVLLNGPRQYGISQMHKHLPEIQKITSLSVTPVLCPIVSDFYSGMEVTVPLFASDIKGTINDIKDVYKSLYSGPVVKFCDNSDENGFMSSVSLSGKDSMEISVHGNEDRILLISRYDNLGKGASGAAIQCMNLVMGIDMTEGLKL